MAKTIVKEIIIGLLLCLAILLILAVLLYAYIPNNKVVPEPVAYTVPEEAEEVLQESSVDTSQVILTYEINSSDLNNAERTNNYNPGKVNPFSAYNTEEVEGTGDQSGTATSGSTTTKDSGDTNSSTDDEQTYYKEKGSK